MNKNFKDMKRMILIIFAKHKIFQKKNKFSLTACEGVK